MPAKTPTLTMDAMKQRVHRAFFPETTSDANKVGLELEVWPFRETAQKQNELIPFFNDQGTGLIQILQKLEPNIDGLVYDPYPDGTPKFTIENGGNLTFEPGGQLEYSGAPMPSVTEAIGAIHHLIELLRCQLKGYGIWFFHSGLNPWYSVEDVGLQLQKPRYTNMNRYFQTIGPYGQKMMRLSTSLQINLDVGDPQTAQRRWLAANLLSPLFNATFANSPFINGQNTGVYSFRSIIWQHLDPSRAGFQKGFLEEPYRPCPVEQYFDFGLNAFLMRPPNAQGEQEFAGTFVSFKEWFDKGHNGYYPTIEDWDFHLTTLFPEVRAKGFFEIRYLDAQSKVWCSVPGILLANILYSQEACEQVIQWLNPNRQYLTQWQKLAAEKGLDDAETARWAKKVLEMALKAAPSNQPDSVSALCERFFERYTYRKRMPATDLLELNAGKVFLPAQYREFERRQLDSVGDILQTICEYV